jgi:hypothetical protein
MPVKSLGRVLMVGHGFLGELDGTKCLSARHFWSQLTKGRIFPLFHPIDINHKNLTNSINRPKITNNYRIFRAQNVFEWKCTL